MSQARLRQGPLNLGEWLTRPPSPQHGALAVFAGTVRNLHEGRAVNGMCYHAHAALAEKRLAEIESEAARRFGAEVEVAHAIGELKVGEASVIVVARAPHRAAAFDACRWAIDTIKQAVPIWKEEHYVEGESRFLDGTPIRSVAES